MKKHYHPLEEELISITGQDPSQCYQCGKCSAGCPVHEFSDTPPNRLIRYVQLGLYEKALSSPAIWMCAGCQTCSERCPQDFNAALFTDALRQVALKHGLQQGDEKSIAFHKAFLNQVKHFGRSYELGLVFEYKMRTLDLFKDVEFAPEMLLKGKLSLLPHSIDNTKEIKKIMRAES